VSAHLWDPEHPYYCAEGCFFSNGCHRSLSWADFLDEFGDADVDLNLVWRWDWHQERDEDTDERTGQPERTLRLHMMHQRKAAPCSFDVRVAPDDEPSVREFLARHWAVVRALWSPLSELP
jgi:hypothetical protein